MFRASYGYNIDINEEGARALLPVLRKLTGESSN